MNKMERTSQCLNEDTLLGYLEKKLTGEDYRKAEEHISNCAFCLNRLSLALEAKKAHPAWLSEKVPSRLIKKAKALVNDDDKDKGRNYELFKAKRRLFLAGTIVFFIASFLLPKYFLQCLTAALILGIRWAFESENGRTLIMVLDSWRRHSHRENGEISNRLKDKFKSPRS
jgi:Flp pilus assembly protein TadB